jgi:hypothetical protein
MYEACPRWRRSRGGSFLASFYGNRGTKFSKIVMYSDGLSDIPTTPRSLKISVKHKWHTKFKRRKEACSARKAIGEHLLAYLDKEIGTCGRTTPRCHWVGCGSARQTQSVSQSLRKEDAKALTRQSSKSSVNFSCFRELRSAVSVERGVKWQAAVSDNEV